MAAVAMLLLIACSNVANLLLSRSTVREKEMGIRASMGATRARLVRQLFVESFVLAVGGCVLGCSFAYLGLKAVVAIIPPGTIPSEVVITLNLAALSFALGSTLLTTLLCGLAPAFHVVRGPLYLRLTGSGEGSGGDFRHGKLRAGLVIVEVALSFILLIASGLTIRTLFALESIQLGFDPTDVLFAQLHHPKSYDSPEEKRVFLRQVLDRVKTIPGVRFATESIAVPPYATGLTDVIVPGREKPESSYAVSELISEDYFDTLRIPLLRGRLFSRGEIDSAQHMVVINQKFARSFFGAEDPIGQKIKFPSWETNYSDWPRSAYFEVIGVVSDTKNKGLRDPTMSQIYLPYTITATGLADDRAIMMKTTGRPESALLSIDKAIHELDSTVAVTDTGTIEKSLRGDYYAEPRFALTTVSTFGALGFVLVIVGIFSVMAYTVSMRTREFGIRMALGAQSGDILRMVLRSGLALILVGAIIGSGISLALTRFLASEIWGASATDPWTFAAVIVLLAGTGLVACFLPARRASQVEPLVALRYE